MTATHGPHGDPRSADRTGPPRRIFGRDPEISALLERWSAERLTVLHGSAGTGKTALIRAAAARIVASQGEPGRVVLGEGRIEQPRAPIGGGNPFTRVLLNVWSSEATPGDTAAELTISEFLRRQPSPVEANIYVAIDQAESLFTDPSREPYARDFLDQLTEALRVVPGLHVLVAVREDFLPDLAVLERDLGPFFRFRLDALGPGAALEAAAGSFRDGGRLLGPGVAEEIVLNLRTSRITDVLGESHEQVADTVEPAQLRALCSALWQALPDDLHEVTLEHLYGLSDLDGALVRFCRDAVRAVAGAHQLSARELAGWLARTFVTDRGTRGTAYEGVADVAGMPHDVVRELVDQHVLSAQRHLGSRWFQLPNDRLIAPVLEVAGLRKRPGWSNAASSLAAAEGALAQGKLILAARRASEAVRTSGDADLHIRASALSCLGRVAAEGGHDQQAESYYGAAAALFEVIQDQAGSGRLLAELGRILLRRGLYAEAVSKLQGAEARLPSDIRIRLDLARALRVSGQLWAATAELGAALTMAPGTVEALVERGLIHIETGEFSAALEDLDNAIRLRPSVGQQSEIRSARQVAHAHLDEPG